MTTLCPAVEKYLMVLTDGCPCNDCEDYRNDFRKCATLQAEWERERVKKAIDEERYRIRNKIRYHFAKYTVMRGSTIVKVKDFLKELGIEQEEKEK